jgi:polysaccharide deacetylase family protein (PEP-CTERM system associated)
VEDYFMVSAFSEIVKPENWDRFSNRVESNTMRVLDIFERHDTRATFFILGWVAERYPRIVKEIDRRGHEIACHSYRHKLVYDMTFEEFREDTGKAKDILEAILGKRIYGYRAPSYSITEKSMWALEILREMGFLYDSSIFPIVHDRYGYPGFPRFPIVLETPSGGILEIPLSTIRIFRKNIPAGGGGYLRLFPLLFTEWAIKNLNGKEIKSAILYFHPWEIDADQPRINGGYLSMFRHYTNIGKTENRIDHLLKTFPFGSISEVFHEHIYSLL